MDDPETEGSVSLPEDKEEEPIVPSGLPLISPDEREVEEELDDIVPTRGYSIMPLIGLGGSAGSAATGSAHLCHEFLPRSRRVCWS